MSDSLLSISLLHQQRMVAVSLLAIVTLAWWYLFYLTSVGMGGMSMPGMQMALAPWSLVDWLSMFAMWAVMMVGMMIPSAAPMILLYGALLRRTGTEEGSAQRQSLFFLLGYVLAWSLFSLVATTMQWGLEQAALLSPMMVSVSPALNGVILIAAGIYQWLPLKEVCLQHCRSPAEFLSAHANSGGPLATGLHHGLYCLGCCWVLMALLFVEGVMNLLWVAVIAAVVLVEKLVPRGDLLGRLLGLVMIGFGLYALYPLVS